MPNYEVIVSNIGTVYSGDDKAVADAKFNSYVVASRKPTEYGRATGETVSLMVDGELLCEACGSLHTE